MLRAYNSSEVFGVSREILGPSYVDRGDLDDRIQMLLGRDVHIALRGESKCGKSWLRQKNIPDAIVVQCRLNKTPKDLYSDALSQLGLRLNTTRSSTTGINTSLEATSEFGASILAKIKGVFSIAASHSQSETTIPVGRDLSDLRFVAEIIKSSGKRLVIGDFHYLSNSERKSFAFDLKALWDYGVFVVIIGIWAERNLILHLNQNLMGRIEELSIYWSDSDLLEVIQKGSAALNIEVQDDLAKRAISDCFGTVGILQKLILDTLDEYRLFRTQSTLFHVDSMEKYESAAMRYADQLSGYFQNFADRVTKGIRERKNSTGIYAHTLKALIESDPAKLMRGIHTNEIFRITHARESRIQKGNLRQILHKLDGIQVDDAGRGLVICYDAGRDEVFVVDKQLLFYSRYATEKWPWERMIENSEEQELTYDADD